MNELTERTKTGTKGELLVQLRLFEHGIQASPPLKDSGNDLIAIKGDCFKAIQVKTKSYDQQNWKKPTERKYHVLALVNLAQNACELDEAEIYLVPKEKLPEGQISQSNEIIKGYKLTQRVIAEIWA